MKLVPPEPHFLHRGKKRGLGLGWDEMFVPCPPPTGAARGHEQGLLVDSPDFHTITTTVNEVFRPGTTEGKETSMKNKFVIVNSTKKLIHPAPGFEKKLLATYHLELAALCGFGCTYCSSNDGYFLRVRRKEFSAATRDQLGREVLPKDDPSLMLVWPDVCDQLERELRTHRAGYGRGETLVLSMLTDAFSPWLVKQGITRKVVDLLIEHTEFRIRILTKNAIVGSPEWVTRFAKHADRFVVGLSTGTLDDDWSRRVEIGTSLPSARLAALAKLQEAGVPTYGMLCPVFPDMLHEDKLDRLLDMVRPDLTEHLWAEPFNDRNNWKAVRDAYPEDSPTRQFLEDVYGGRTTALWSAYAADLYERLRRRAERENWLPKLRYLLYESLVTVDDARRFGDLAGVLLQGKTDEAGYSRNLAIAEQTGFALHQ